MANEIAFSASLAITKNNLTASGNGSKSVTLANDAYSSGVQSIGNTTEAIALGDAANPGYLYVKNLDATNFIEIGLTSPVTSGNAMIKLLPGEFAFLPTRQTTIYALADTATCLMHVVVTEL